MDKQTLAQACIVVCTYYLLVQEVFDPHDNLVVSCPPFCAFVYAEQPFHNSSGTASRIQVMQLPSSPPSA